MHLFEKNEEVSLRQMPIGGMNFSQDERERGSFPSDRIKGVRCGLCDRQELVVIDLERLEGSMTIFTMFLRDEDGAVTIDWVALTAGILLLGIAVVWAIFRNGVEPLVSTIEANLSTAGSGVSTGTAPSF